MRAPSETTESGPPIPYPGTGAAAAFPYPFYDWARTTCPVHRLPGRDDVFFISRYEDVRYATNHPEIFSSVDHFRATGIGHWADMPAATTPSGIEIRPVVDSDPPQHEIHRRFASAPFRPGALKLRRQDILNAVDTLIDGFAGRGHCDFVEEFAAPLPALVSCDMMGFSHGVLDRLVAWGSIEVSGGAFLGEEDQSHQLAVAEELHAFVSEAMEERIAHPRDDGLSDLIRAQAARDGELNADYVRVQANNLIFGGIIITTAHMLGTAMLLLLQNPQQMRIVVDDPTKIGRMLEEALRLESPVQWVPRRVVQDVTVSGTLIPAGSYALLGWASANRDSARWEGPENFEVGRQGPEKHLAFGHGAHVCLGAPLARLEGRLAFERLLFRLKNIRPRPGASSPFLDSPSFRGLRELQIEFDVE